MKQIPRELMDEIIKRLVNGLQPEKIILFGSHAYGTPADTSDIDLLIVVPKSEYPRHRRARDAYRYLRGLTAPTELIVLTRQEMNREASVPVSLANRVIQYGKVLYG